ncbi:hypothetical protein BLNAU_5526 [Blattamonas nauphoetae]|uniref:Uncharacterized protein n=1 Tax=Blattamonas nauphoetae TaxID=2049346 RepID=A0ABQ9Y6T5_9EUKA|nr:hypothetical protein BLNAU_5526 [Blattamonas nauphoetae]
MAVISLCENICESVEMDDPDTGFTTPNLRSIGHQLALLYHALKRMAPYFCEELQGHFSAVKAVWESNFLAVEEKECFIQVAPILFACVGIRVYDDAADSLSAAHDSAHSDHSPRPSFLTRLFPSTSSSIKGPVIST